MHGLFSKNYLRILSPVDGKVVDLSYVPDEVFSQKLVGDGVAVLPSSNIIKAPADGIIKKFFNTNHAFLISTTDNIEILVHIGIDTFDLKGEGFEKLVEEGTNVTAGESVLKVDFDFLKDSGKEILILVLISTMDKVRSMKTKIGSFVTSGKDDIIEYSVR